MFFWREHVPATSWVGPGSVGSSGVDWGFTSSAGGVSTGDFGGLNLGGHVGDDPAAVAANRTMVADSLDLQRDQLLFLNQCHGADVVTANAAWGAHAPAADAVVTTRTDLALGVLVADCTPVLLADRQAGVVGAVHAGRPGMTAGIVGRTLDAMADLGARTVSAVVGPSVCGRCYEVPAAMRDGAARTSPVAATVSWTGTPAVDVAAGVVDQLQARSVAIRWVPGCTRETAELYSYRRSGRTGRFAGVVRLLGPAEPALVQADAR